MDSQQGHGPGKPLLSSLRCKLAWLITLKRSVGKYSTHLSIKLLLEDLTLMTQRKRMQLAPESLVNPGICLSGSFLSHGYCHFFPKGI